MGDVQAENGGAFRMAAGVYAGALGLNRLGDFFANKFNNESVCGIDVGHTAWRLVQGQDKY